MSAEFSIEDEDAKAFLKQAIRNVKKITDRTREYVNFLSPVVFQDIMAHFSEQRGSQGSWKKWSSVYKAHMQKIGKGGNRILQDTGRLRGSFTPNNYKINSDAIVWFNPARTANGFPYALAHDEGGPKLPKRDYMWLSDTAKEKIETLTLKFLEDGL
jgi:phage gpG-like protein